jgi:hypothetical protein
MSHPIEKRMDFEARDTINLPCILKNKNYRFKYYKHYNNMGLFCDPNIITNNKERNFQKPAVANHNSSQTLDLL